MSQETTDEASLSGAAQLVNLADLYNIPILNVTNLDQTEISTGHGQANIFTENSFVCQQLIDKYGSEESQLKELHELLFSWNLTDLFSYFQSK